MKYCLRTVSLLVLFLFSTGCAAATEQTVSSAPPSDGDARKPTVVLVSLDGFRWDYPDLYETPNLDRIAQRGVRARRLIPVFPTKTFPNHYTLVTGLYPENHGIVSNTIYDPDMDASFSLGNRAAIKDPRWWSGEPLWVTAEKQGQIAATYFWPGSEAPIEGVRPTYWREYDGSVPPSRRIDQVLEWLDLPPEKRPTFITLYFSDVDTRGHRYDPVSPEVGRVVRTADRHIGRLLDGLERRGLLDTVHLIITSDHGMAPTSPERVILLDDYIDLDDVRIIEYTPTLMLHPKAGREDAVYAALKNVHPHLDVYRKQDLPARLHFSDHPRIPSLIGLADEGWSITTRSYFQKNPDRYAGGDHGYDNRFASMHGIFYAQGPAFKAGVRAAPFSSVHLYTMMAEILGLSPAPNDGDLDAVRSFLNQDVLSAKPPAR